MISGLLVLLLLFFVGVSESGGIFWRATNCESPLVYCVRERLFTFCVDFKDFTVRWKFHLECLSRSSCFYADFPCKTSPRYPDFHPNNVDGTSSTSPSSFSKIGPKMTGTKRSSGLVGAGEAGPKNLRAITHVIVSPTLFEFHSKTRPRKITYGTTPSSSPRSSSRTWLDTTGTRRSSVPVGYSQESPGNTFTSTLVFASTEETKNLMAEIEVPSLAVPTFSTSSARNTKNSGEMYPKNLEAFTSPFVSASGISSFESATKVAMVPTSHLTYPPPIFPHESRTMPSSSSRSIVNSHEAITMSSYVLDRTMRPPTIEPTTDESFSALTYPVLPKTPNSSYGRSVMSSSSSERSSEVYPENFKTIPSSNVFDKTVMMEEEEPTAVDRPSVLKHSGLSIIPIFSRVRSSSSSAKTIVGAMASSDLLEKTTMEQVEVQTTNENAKPTPPTACNSTGRYPGPSCKEYYECIVVWWWFDVRLRFCAEGFAFSVANRTCVPTAYSDCLN